MKDFNIQNIVSSKMKSALVTEKYIPMLTTGGLETWKFPVKVYDLNTSYLGVANDKEEYLLIWNNAPTNANAGHLIGAFDPFSFYFKSLTNFYPDNILGDPFDGEPFIINGDYLIINVQQIIVN